MSKIIAYNVNQDIKKAGKFRTRPFGEIPGVCVIDAGEKAVWIFTNTFSNPDNSRLWFRMCFMSSGDSCGDKHDV